MFLQFIQGDAGIFHCVVKKAGHYQFNIQVFTAGRDQLSNLNQMIEIRFTIGAFALLLGMLLRGKARGGQDPPDCSGRSFFFHTYCHNFLSRVILPQGVANYSRCATTIFAVMIAWPTCRCVWSATWTSSPPTEVGSCFLPTLRPSSNCCDVKARIRLPLLAKATTIPAINSFLFPPGSISLFISEICSGES